MSEEASILFVGLGSPHGDDQIGWRVAELLASCKPLPPALMIRKAAIPLDLLDWLEDVDCLMVCDAAESSARMGTLERWEWNAPGKGSFETQDVLPVLKRLRGRSSHDFELPAVLDLAARFHQLPQRVVIWTISAGSFEAGRPLSEELERAAPMARNQILAELNHA